MDQKTMSWGMWWVCWGMWWVCWGPWSVRDGSKFKSYGETARFLNIPRVATHNDKAPGSHQGPTKDHTFGPKSRFLGAKCCGSIFKNVLPTEGVEHFLEKL